MHKAWTRTSLPSRTLVAVAVSGLALSLLPTQAWASPITSEGNEPSGEVAQLLGTIPEQCVDPVVPTSLPSPTVEQVEVELDEEVPSREESPAQETEEESAPVEESPAVQGDESSATVEERTASLIVEAESSSEPAPITAPVTESGSDPTTSVSTPETQPSDSPSPTSLELPRGDALPGETLEPSPSPSASTSASPTASPSATPSASPISAVKGLRAIACPTSVEGVSVQPGDRQVTVSWAVDPANTATSYFVISQHSSDVIEVLAPQSEVLVPGLRNGRTYSFAVVAAHEFGSAPASSWVEVTPVSGMEGEVPGLLVEFADASAITEGQEQVPGEESVTVTDLTVRDEIANDVHVVEFAQALTESEAANVASQLQADPNVVWAEPDLFVAAASIAAGDASIDDTEYDSRQWNLWDEYGVGVDDGELDALDAVNSADGDGVVVSVIDTGITAHPDLDGQLVDGYDFVSSPDSLSDERSPGVGDVAFDGDYVDAGRFGSVGRDADPSDPGDWRDVAPVRSSSWHGTHMAGIIAARTGNAQGVAGLAPAAKVQPIRALSWRGGLLSDVVASITWASGGSVSGVPDNRTPANVINMSFTAEAACPASLQQAISDATGRGAVVIAAAGNAGADAGAFAPANCADVIAVGASDRAGKRAAYSNFGSTVDVSAPGGDVNTDGGVVSTVNSGSREPADATYGGRQGTSIAAAHISAVAARTLSVESLTPGAVAQKITGRDAVKAFADGACDDDASKSCGSGIVSLFQAATQTETDVWNVGSSPGQLEMTPDNTKAVVINRNDASVDDAAVPDNSVSVVTVSGPNKGRIVTHGVAANPLRIALNATGTRAYVSHGINPPVLGPFQRTVTVLDITKTSNATSAQVLGTLNAGCDVMDLKSIGGKLFMACKNSDMGGNKIVIWDETDSITSPTLRSLDGTKITGQLTVSGGYLWSKEASNSGILYRIDPATEEKLPTGAPAGGNAIAVSPNGMYYFTANSDARGSLWRVSVESGGSATVLRASGAPRRPVTIRNLQHNRFLVYNELTELAQYAASSTGYSFIEGSGICPVGVNCDPRGGGLAVTSDESAAFVTRADLDGAGIAYTSGTLHRVALSPFGPPVDPVFMQVNPGNGQVEFQARYGDGGIAPTSLRVRVQGDTGKNCTPVNYWCTITGLTNGTEYTFELVAANNAGESVVTRTATPRTTPSAPTDLSASVEGSTATISFTAGANGGTPIVRYDYSLDGTRWSAVPDSQTTSPVTITGLALGTTHEIRLRAVTALNGASSSPVSATTPALPSAPTSVSVADRSQTSLAFSFTPGADGGAAITNYEVRVNNGAWTAMSPAVTSSPLTISSLSANTSYRVQIRAVSVAGSGTASSVVTAQTLAPPAPPSDPAPQVTPSTQPTATTSAAATISSTTSAQTPAQAANQAAVEAAQSLARRPAAAISAQQIAALPAAAVANMRVEQVSNLRPTAIAAMNAEQISALPAAAVAALTTDQTRALPAQALAEMKPTQVAAMPVQMMSALSSSQVAALPPSAMSVLKPEQVSALSPRSLSAMEPTQVAALPTRAVAALTPAQVEAIPPAALAELKPTQVAALPTALVSAMRPAQLSALPASAFVGFSPQQVSALPPAALTRIEPAQMAALPVRALERLEPAQAAALPARALSELRPAQLAALPNETLAALSTGQVAAMSSTVLGTMQPEQLRSLSPRVLAALPLAKVLEIAPAALLELTSQQREALGDSVRQVIAQAERSIRRSETLTRTTSNELAQTSASEIEAFSASDVAAIPATALRALSTSQVEALPAAAVAGFSPRQIAALSPTTLGALSSEQLAVVSPRAIAAITSAQAEELPKAFFAALTADQVASLDSRVLQALDPSQSAGLNTAALVTMSAKQVTSLSPRSIAAMSADSVASLPSETFRELSTEQITSLSQDAVSSLSPEQVAAIPSRVFSSLSAEFITALPTEALASLTPRQLSLLPPAVVSALPAEAMSTLPASAIQSLSPQQVAVLNPVVLEKFTAEQVAALPTDALASLSVEQLRSITDVAFSSMTPTQVGALSPTFIAALSPAAITMLPEASIAKLTPTQMRALPSESLSQLTADQLAAVEPRTLASLSGEQLTALAPTAFAQLTGDQVRSLNPQSLAELSPEVFQALPARTLSGLSAQQVALLPATVIGAMSPEQVKALPAQALAGVPASVVKELPPSTIASVTPQQMASAPTTWVASLNDAQVAVLPPAAIRTMSPIQIAAIEPAAMAGMKPGQVGSLPAPTIRVLTSEQIAALPAVAFGGLNAQQLPQLRPTVLSVLTAEQVSAIAANAMRTMSGDQLRALPPQALGEMRGQQVRNLPTPTVARISVEQFQALPREAVAGFTPQQFGVLPREVFSLLTPTQWSAVELRALKVIKPEQVTLLPVEILESVTPLQVRQFAPAVVAALTVDQIKAIPASTFASMTRGQLRALTLDQAKAITSEQWQALSVSNRTALQRRLGSRFTTPTPAPAAQS